MIEMIIGVVSLDTYRKYIPIYIYISQLQILMTNKLGLTGHFNFETIRFLFLDQADFSAVLSPSLLVLSEDLEVSQVMGPMGGSPGVEVSYGFIVMGMIWMI